MIVKSISVPAFRNLKEIELEFDEHLNIITGENGQGKTNLLEAMWLFTGSKSFTGAKTSEMQPFDSDFFKAEMTFFGGKRENVASYLIGQRKDIQLNFINQKALAGFAGAFLAVIFSPEHLNLVKGGPAIRRKALDLIICQLKPRYLSVLTRYNQLLTQRNALLKDIRLGKSSKELLCEWDIALSQAGALITKTRLSYTQKLFPLCTKVYDGISYGREELTLEYKHSFAGEINECAMTDLLNKNQRQDILTATTSVGPHRDEMEILLNGKSARTFASQGQQRSAVLALKIGESELIEQIVGERPVILLDDVMSELDESRQGFLLERFDGCQIFITCCDAHQIALADKIITIKHGRIVV